MTLGEYLAGFLSVGAVILIVATIPFMLTAISYRQRDNGLAYLLLVLGVGIWNGMVVVQLLSPRTLVRVFFLSLAIVGALLAGLGWFMFASTASHTSERLDRSEVYSLVAVLVGIDIAVAATAPAHDVYWTVPAAAPLPGEYLAVTPNLGLWLHTGLLVALIGTGTWLFADAWRSGVNVGYSRTYVLAGSLTVVAIVASVVSPSRFQPLASVAAGGLAATGWVQAKRGRVFDTLARVLS